MKLLDRPCGSAGKLLCGSLLTAFLAIWIGTACVAVPPAGIPLSSGQGGQTLVAGAVDLAAVITFHPTMRNFDYRSGKFVSQVAVPGATTGAQAWKETQDEQRRIKSLESAIEAQIQRVNSELNRDQSDRQKKTDRPEFNKLARMNEEYKELLRPLAERILGGFPEHLLGNLPSQNLERVMGEVFWAVQASAQARGAAIVLNTSTGDFKPGLAASMGASESGSEDILERWSIRSLGDIEALVQASGTSRMPFEGGRPKPRAGLVCGGHFESVTDPAMLKSLVTEFYNNRHAFSQPFLKQGATRHVLSGTLNVSSIDLTYDAVSRLLDLYKTRAAERDAILTLLRERLGN